MDLRRGYVFFSPRAGSEQLSFSGRLGAGSGGISSIQVSLWHEVLTCVTLSVEPNNVELPVLAVATALATPIATLYLVSFPGIRT
ncbi:MAG TPA: hypothetical protein PK661_00700 [Syntrophorhabdaceae bacterium]|nr:hypothetical protein [Pseudomonadota bacterium]HOS58589.1 hypothetical protein [Syntrophorhabdaceae bacterium]